MIDFNIDFENTLRNSSTNLYKLFVHFKKTGIKEDYLLFIECLFNFINGLSQNLKEGVYDKMFIDTAKGRWLDIVIFQEMGLKRINSMEQSEQFRRRALAYYAFIQRGFTNTSIKDFIETFGYEVIKIVSAFDTGSWIKQYGKGYPIISKSWINYITIFHIQNIIIDDVIFLQGMIETVRPRAISKVLIRKYMEI